MPRVTRGLLRALCPRPKSGDKASIWDGYVEALTSDACAKLFLDFKVVSALRLAHLLAQWAHESGGFTLIWESGTYSATRITQIFGVGQHSAAVTEREAKALAGDGEALFERVYGLGNPKKAKELGNTQAGDGWRFRGCGIVQITGRAAHEEYAKEIGCRLEDLALPLNSIHAAFLEWADKGCNALADKDDILAITKKINGGTNGLADRKKYLEKVKTLLREHAREPVDTGGMVSMPMASGDAPWLDHAMGLLGTKEVSGKKANNDTIMQLYRDCGHPEVDADETAWCAAMVGACLARAGKPTSMPVDVNLMARSYLKYGKKLDKPQRGAIRVWPRGKAPQGHVGFILEVDEAKGTLKTIEGNVGNQVQIKTHKIKEDFLGDFWPPETSFVGVAKEGAKLAPQSKSFWGALVGGVWLGYGYMLDGAQGAFDGAVGVLQMLPGISGEIDMALSTGEKFSTWLGLPFAKLSVGIVIGLLVYNTGRHLRDKYWAKQGVAR
jgi:uncharacterized protein (TIGR02594 family)